MTIKSLTLATLSALNLFSAMEAWSAEEMSGTASPSYPATSSERISSSTVMVQSLQRASDLIGKSVTNQQRERLGKISDVLIDINSGRAAYIVLSADVEGARDKLFAIPMTALQPQPDPDRLVLNIDKDRLQNAPEFNKDRWSDIGSRDFGSRVHEYYGITPYWEAERAPGSMTGPTSGPGIGALPEGPSTTPGAGPEPGPSLD